MFSHWEDELDWDKINSPNIVFNKSNTTGEIFCKHKNKNQRLAPAAHVKDEKSKRR